MYIRRRKYFGCLIFVGKAHRQNFFNGENFPNYGTQKRYLYLEALSVLSCIGTHSKHVTEYFHVFVQKPGHQVGDNTGYVNKWALHKDTKKLDTLHRP